ncbi:MAG: hypothetical protein OIN88_11325 [Candidatus Methanoperedens sp.]|nr:hypothetical protein [Candidatus Methanoperedens sp.]MCZ7359009.1 hypothetical protein [Candidatus Methanoperedens sp.]HLB71827.1 hypothetical protein [Candidatus Methanoperedens sp.]
MEYVRLDKAGKIYLPKTVRSKMDVESKYTVLTLPDGDIVLHRIKESEDPLKDFQSLGMIKKPLSDVKKDILNEALEEAGE